MKQFTYYLNLILTIVAFIIVFIETIIDYDLDSGVGFLVILGFFQVFISFILTFYAIAYNRLLLIFYVLYWFFVTLFFKFFIQPGLFQRDSLGAGSGSQGAQQGKGQRAEGLGL